MKYANVDVEGYVIGFYSTDLFKLKDIPTPFHEIKTQTWEAFLAGSLVKWDGSKWVSYTHDQTRDKSLNKIKEIKYEEIWGEFERIVKRVNGSSKKFHNRDKRQQTKAEQRLTKGKSKLTAKEKGEDTWYALYLGWIDNMYSRGDAACDVVDAMVDKQDIANYDVAATPAWPMFAAPTGGK